MSLLKSFGMAKAFFCNDNFFKYCDMAIYCYISIWVHWFAKIIRRRDINLWGIKKKTPVYVLKHIQNWCKNNVNVRKNPLNSPSWELQSFQLSRRFTSASWTTNSPISFFLFFHQFHFCLLSFTSCKWIKFKQTLNREIGWSQTG